METFRLNHHLSNRRIATNKEKIEEILEKLAAGIGGAPAPIIELPKGGDIDMNALANAFASKAALMDLEKRLAACEKSNSSQDEILQLHEDSINRTDQDFKMYVD